MALVYTPESNNEKCPEFTLKAVDGNNYSRSDFAEKSLIVVFICNHCPYVQAIEDRLIELNKSAKKLGANMIGICSNDEESYPEDSFSNLKKRWEEKKYNFPYLHDKAQDVAKQFGAVCTPDFFVYDKQHILQYRGRLDDNWQDFKNVTKHELLDALSLIIQEKPVNFSVKPSMGCSIKWK